METQTSVVADDMDGDGLHFEKFSVNFFKILVPIFKAKPKLYHGLLFFINVSGLNLQAIFTALVKVRKKGFCIVLAAKQQKCRDRVPLSKCTRARSFVYFQSCQ